MLGSWPYWRSKPNGPLPTFKCLKGNYLHFFQQMSECWETQAACLWLCFIADCASRFFALVPLARGRLSQLPTSFWRTCLTNTSPTSWCFQHAPLLTKPRISSTANWIRGKIPFCVCKGSTPELSISINLAIKFPPMTWRVPEQIQLWITCRTRSTSELGLWELVIACYNGKKVRKISEGQ